MHEESSPPPKCQWGSYGNYRLILWAWMMNEVSFVFATTEISHNGFYVHAAIHSLSTILIGIPLVYSEICIAQYTNAGVVAMWNFFPILRGIGYGTIFLTILKATYITVLTSWYLEYTFYAACDPPPWFSCEEFNNTYCMVKKVNVSIFQNCLDRQSLFDEDCGMRTASNYFFERKIGENNTLQSFICFYPWKGVMSTFLALALFLLSIKKEKCIQFIIKLFIAYMSAVIIVLLCVSLSTSGSWYATKVSYLGDDYNVRSCFKSITDGILSVGTGYGIIGYLSRDVSFRSPATITSIATTLFSTFIIIMLSLIIFSGIKAMSYYHGEEENIIEINNSSFFLEFASISEILSYFDNFFLWGFAWFSTGFWCLFVNVWIIYLFWRDLLLNNVRFAIKHSNLTCMLVAITISLFSWPFFCSDLAASLTDAVEILQITNNLFFSLSLYWIYGYKNHNIDIIFMIGIRASYFWKITWILNPLVLISVLYFRSTTLIISENTESYLIESLSIECDILLFIIIISIYVIIVSIGVIIEITIYYQNNHLLAVFIPTEDWGPKDQILAKSRKMFKPEIMTREFLYRQVRIHGYYKNRRDQTKPKNSNVDLSPHTMEWNEISSN